MSLHVAMSMLTNLAMALAHLKADDYAHMRIKLPKVRERKPEPAQDVDPGLVAALLMHQFNDPQRAA